MDIAWTTITMRIHALSLWSVGADAMKRGQNDGLLNQCSLDGVGMFNRL